MFARWFGYSILVVAFVGLLSFFCEIAYSREVAIFSVNKTLQMDPDEPVYHDYYISGGSEQGFRTGMQVTVIRRVPVHDLSRNRALGDLRLPIAKLKLIFVQKGMAVGRLATLTSAKNSPIVDYNGVMIGDAISLGNGLDANGIMEVNEEGEGNSGKSESGDSTLKSEGTSDEKAESKSEVPAAVESTSAAPEGAPEPAPLTPEEITKNLMPKETKTDVSSRVPAAAEPKPAKPKEKQQPSAVPHKADPAVENTLLAPKA
ncbi:MAG: hypothetical protein AB7F59_14480 [Bdellovibrionales bacterium]